MFLKYDSKQINSAKFRDFLLLLAPWLKVELDGNFQLENGTSHGNIDEERQKQALTWTVLNNVFYLTIIFGDIYLKEIENLWASLIEGNNLSLKQRRRRVSIVINYLILMILYSRNIEVIYFAKVE